MNLLDLALMTGHKSISDMTYAEVVAHVLNVRKSRLVTKHSDLKMSERNIDLGPPSTDIPKKTKAKATAKSKLPDPAALTQAEIAALLSKLGG